MRKNYLMSFIFILVFSLLQGGCGQGETEKKIVKKDLPNGAVYEGTLENDEPHGQGTMSFPDGAEYVGQFENGKPNGEGTMDFPDGRKYLGGWKDGKFFGQGTLTWEDGSKYVGLFDHKPNGQGLWTYPDGSKQEGVFKDGELFDGRLTAPPTAGEKSGTQFEEILVIKDGKPFQTRKASVYKDPDGKHIEDPFKHMDPAIIKEFEKKKEMQPPEQKEVPQEQK